MLSINLKSWLFIVLTLCTTQINADVLQKVERKLNRYSWNYSVHTQSAHLSYGYKFVRPELGGVFSYAINGQRRSHTFAKYTVGKPTKTQLAKLGKLFQKKMDMSQIRGVVILTDGNGHTLNWLLIVNERCLLDVKNIGASMNNCLIPKR